MEHFPENLRRRAGELGLPNAEVARRAGLTERRYGNYVTGSRQPDLASLVRIAVVLETTVDELVAPEGLYSRDQTIRARFQAALGALAPDDLELVLIQLEAVVRHRRATK